ncbi:hypothetical protein Ais01nite_25620 [Asanoa ishikariensis]|uniref:DUF5709 domain-containing protein n=1 Tax=Asanoa ishikariensis TaxID=137265 RepID=A0A1H3R1K2_9ACTN|nr:DUF5709 domain-containing protein [Asanoa ishikariensis]GIF64527.1 hypothetical protein Ais01nite_25620 [Asanoa ishikariensis]SDZ19171.1 hypothetical protein SAMN05421684_3358 [Asanoa ishikariensis]
MRREDEYPEPWSDPEAEGLPGTADDDSTAYDDVESEREIQGPDPAALPVDSPLAVDRFGTTGEEAEQGESLDYKLARENLPEEVDDPLATPADPKIRDEEDLGTEKAQSQLDADVLDDGPKGDPNSEVSLYDTDGLELDGGGAPIGRLVDPNQLAGEDEPEGALLDDEGDSIADDAGAAGGGATAEELAMHETEEPPYE